MADVEQSSGLNSTENGTDTGNGTAARFVATAEGTALAYGSLVLMALLPIFFGALRSVSTSKSKNSSDMPETITSRDAARFPIIASCTLFGLYLFFKFDTKDLISLGISSIVGVWYILKKHWVANNLFGLAFALNGVELLHLNNVSTGCILLGGLFIYDIFWVFGTNVMVTVAKSFEAPIKLVFPQDLLEKGLGASNFAMLGLGDIVIPEIVNYEFDTKDLISLGISSIVGVWYILKKHWVANNLFGLAFALNGVELLHLNNVSTGCILLGGLFIYDIFWVFGTNVMVTVAKSFEAPIKLVFPQDLLEKGLGASNFAMLGLGDIVIPGIFIALLLRFDVSLKKNTRTYFYTSFLAYIFGLGLTIFVMHTFKHAQPALLYLVPACVGFPVIVALFKGELTEMFRYEESSPESEASTKEEKTESDKDK
ncbi:hypothetical protein PDJAM_G00069150 [Pangasius djambal]|uniref:Uncharacterized protein n=1 Tax=Pangasius djambal TaxID=1691987 RepID=A0ACC5Z0Z6_9TELE|nr:hypothetical protein [Pangasius djambal]